MKDDEKNKDTLCLVFCPYCKEATNGVSFNLLKNVKQVFVDCSSCGGITIVSLNEDEVYFERG